MTRSPSKRKKPLAPKSQVSPPVLLILLGAVLVFAVLLYLALSGGNTSNGAQTTNPNVPYPEVERVSLSDAKKAFDDKTAVFLDVRSVSSFQASHIPGAINIPADQIASSLEELDPQQWIITYCT